MRLNQELTEITGFRRGVAAGTDPQPQAEPHRRAREAVTHSASRWADGLPCPTCGQTFRSGDRVLVDEAGHVRHLDPALRCAAEPRSDHEDEEAEHREFSRGLLAAWPPAPGIEPVELEAGDFQVATPGRGRAQRCVECGETFRAGEIVVICPCHPGGSLDAPGRCGLAVHRDPAAGLPCWEQWCPSGVVTICPLDHTPTAAHTADLTIRVRR